MIKDDRILAKGQQYYKVEIEESISDNELPPLTREEIDIGEELTEEQTNCLLTLQSNFQSCFATSLQKLG